MYGWQELILNRAGACARCDAALAAGAQAWRGLSDRPGQPAFLCHTCVGQLRRSDATNGHEEETSR